MIERFVCRGFRNLEPLEWLPGEGRRLVVGANGAGKTSLLEALYMLATGRSFRGARPAECCQRGEEAFFLEAEVDGERRASLSVGWSAGGGLERRLNGKPATLSEHLAVQPVVAWTGADDELLDGPPELRRRLLDQGLVAERPGSLAVLARYRQALEQKRRLLADGHAGLGPWNELLAAAAAELVVRRREHAERLAAMLAAVLADAGFERRGLELGEVEMVYRPSVDPGAGRAEAGGAEGESSADEAVGERGAAAILRRLEAAREDERRQRRPLVGPHRDELEVRWRGRGLRRAASAGEKKLLGLALTAARGRVLEAAGRPPLYLLDDPDGDLDRRRLAASWELFERAPQLVATSHRPKAWEALGEAPAGRLEEGLLKLSGKARETGRNTDLND